MFWVALGAVIVQNTGQTHVEHGLPPRLPEVAGKYPQFLWI